AEARLAFGNVAEAGAERAEEASVLLGVIPASLGEAHVRVCHCPSNIGPAAGSGKGWACIRVRLRSIPPGPKLHPGRTQMARRIEADIAVKRGRREVYDFL